MSNLTTKGKEAKTVTSATDKRNSNKSEIIAETQKNDLEEKKEKINAILNPITAEQRIKNAENFQKLAEKHKFLTEKSDELNAFMIGRDGLKEKIIIQNDNDQSFEISNSLVIEEVLNLCAKKLDTLTDESRDQILNFSI